MDTTSTPRILRSLAAAALAAAVVTAAVSAGASPPGSAAARPRCGGAVATVVGTSGADVLKGTPRRDVIWAGPGNDVVRGLAGADLICGGPGADTCTGGPGEDRLTSCRAADAERWDGSAHGTLDQGNGVVETWTATYRMAPVVPGASWAGAATIEWRVSGTDPLGCTYGGNGTLPGRASLTIWDALKSYDHQVYREVGTTVPVTVACPGQEPQVVTYQPLDTNAAEASVRLPGNPARPLTGTATYVPMNAAGGAVEWSWSASGRT